MRSGRAGLSDRAPPESGSIGAAAGPGSSLATCGLSLGLTALGAGRVDDAAAWFTQAVRADSTSWTGRRALIGLGDARVGQGDILAAAIAFQSVVDTRTGPADSLARIAEERLRALGRRGPDGHCTKGDAVRRGLHLAAPDRGDRVRQRRQEQPGARADAAGPVGESRRDGPPVGPGDQHVP